MSHEQYCNLLSSVAIFLYRYSLTWIFLILLVISINVSILWKKYRKMGLIIVASSVVGFIISLNVLLWPCTTE